MFFSSSMMSTRSFPVESGEGLLASIAPTFALELTEMQVMHTQKTTGCA